MEKDIKIFFRGKEEVITIGQITWKDKTDAIKKSMKDVQRGRQLKREIDNISLKEIMMIKSIVKSPFVPSVEILQELTAKDGERIYAVFSELNEPDEDDGEGEESSGNGSTVVTSLN